MRSTSLPELPIVEVPVCLSAEGTVVLGQTEAHVARLHGYGYRSFLLGGAIEGGLIKVPELVALLDRLREKHGADIELVASFASNCVRTAREALKLIDRQGLADRVFHHCEYYSKLHFQQLLGHWAAVRDASTVPLYLYQGSPSVLKPSDLCTIVREVGLSGVVDGGGSVALLMHLRLNAGKSLEYIHAHTEAFADPFLSQGASRYVSRLANVVPRLVLELQELRSVGDSVALRARLRCIEALEESLDHASPGAGLRALLARQSGYGEFCRLPMVQLPKQDGNRLADLFTFDGEMPVSVETIHCFAAQ